MLQSTQMNVSGKKILILRFGAMGDIIHTTVIARAIKNKYPDCYIAYCVENRYKEIIQNTQYIDEIIPYDEKLRKKLSYNINFAIDLKQQNFDIIFNLTNALRNNLISIIAHPKKIINHKKERNLHVVENFFETALKGVDNLELPKNLEVGVDNEISNKIKRNVSKYPRPYFVFSPAGSNDKARQGRIWNKDYWIELGNQLIREYGGTVFITGAPNEAEFHKTIAQNIDNSVLYSGELSVSESMCLYSFADLVISGDTGPLHLASALNVKTIGIFGSTDIKNVRPWGEKGYYVCPDDNVCRFCWNKKCKFQTDKYTLCMESIKPEKIMELIRNEINL